MFHIHTISVASFLQRNLKEIIFFLVSVDKGQDFHLFHDVRSERNSSLPVVRTATYAR